MSMGQRKKYSFPLKQQAGPLISELQETPGRRSFTMCHTSCTLLGLAASKAYTVQPTRLRPGTPMRVDIMKFSRLGLRVYSMECGRCLNLTFYDISLIYDTGVGPLSLFKLLLIKKISCGRYLKLLINCEWNSGNRSLNIKQIAIDLWVLLNSKQRQTLR